jgi:hypothetical protein
VHVRGCARRPAPARRPRRACLLPRCAVTVAALPVAHAAQAYRHQSSTPHPIASGRRGCGHLTVPPPLNQEFSVFSPPSSTRWQRNILRTSRRSALRPSSRPARVGGKRVSFAFLLTACISDQNAVGIGICRDSRTQLPPWPANRRHRLNLRVRFVPLQLPQLQNRRG